MLSAQAERSIRGNVMVTPREKRFGKIAVESGILTRDQLLMLVGFESRKQAEGTNLTLWESAVLNKMMDAAQAEELLGKVGELDVEQLGKYKLLKHLGRGGMGSVWLAMAPDKSKVAVKVLHSSFAGDRSLLTRFFREAQSAVSLEHKNIVHGVEVGESDGNYYFAMEYVEGASVQSMLDREGSIAPQRAAEIILEVAAALAYAHERNTIHRDIKPDNIMVTRGGHAKLADLGLARVTQEGLTQLTGTGTSMGTPMYMAPEQCSDAKRADARSDIYSLGATWYHMVVGRPPFTGSSALELMQKHTNEALQWPTSARTTLRKGVILTIQRMMAKRPEARIQTMREVIETIKEQCLGERDIFKELGVKKEAAADVAWYLKSIKDGKEKTVRVSHVRLTQMIQWGKISPDTLVCRANEQGLFVPIHKEPALAPMLPTTITPPPSKKRDKAPHRAGKHESLHSYLEHFDENETRRRRKKKLKKLAWTVLKILIWLAVIGALYLGYQRFWPQISEAIKSSRSATPVEGSP